MVLSIENHVFLVEHKFREGDNYTDHVKDTFSKTIPQTPVHTAMQFTGLSRNSTK